MSPTATYFDSQNPANIGVAVSTSDPVPLYQASRSTTPHSGMVLNRPHPYGAGVHGGVGSGPAEWEMEDVRQPVSTALAYCGLSYPDHVIHIRVISNHTVTTIQGITSRSKVNNPLHMER